jgi:hypothetical protein
MGTVIGTLTVNLEANTATFSGDLGKASGDLKVFADDAGAAGTKVDYSMMEARHGVMMLGEELGIHLPRGVTTFIASLGPVGAAMEMAFPFLAIILGATILIEHFTKLHDAALKAAEAGTHAFEEVGQSLEDATAKSRELKIKIAELTGSSVTALETKLHSVRDLLASMKLAPGLKAEFADFAKSIEMPTNWNPLNWFGFSVAASKEVKAETQSAALAIANATTLEEKQANAARELSKAHLELADIQKMGNEKAIEEQLRLIELLDDTNKQLLLEVSNKNDSNKVDAIVKEQAAVLHLARDHGELAAARKKAAEEATRQDEIIARSQEEITRTLEDLVAKQLELNAKVVASYERVKEASLKANSAGDKSAIEAQAEAGIISRQSAANAMHAIDQQELTSYTQHLASELAALQAHLQKTQAAAKAAQGGSQSDEMTKQAGLAQIAYNDAVAKGVIEQQKLANAVNQSQAAAQKLQANWSTYFTQMKTETGELSVTINTTLQSSMTKFTDGFASAISKSIVEGKSLGAAMKDVGKQILEGMISTLVKWVEQWIISHTIMAAVSSTTGATTVATGKLLAAQLAGANAVASFSLAPWPVDMGAPAFGASMMAAAASFEGGGEIGGSGAVPIMAHAGETVVTKALTDQVKAAESGAGSGDTHFHYAPQVHAIDGDGVEKMLNQHAGKFAKAMSSHLRRMNH